MKLGMTGSRDGLSDKALSTVKDILSKIKSVAEVHHGDCLGADKIFHDLAVSCGYKIVIHPPDKDIMRAGCTTGNPVIRDKQPYIKRNHNIVNECNILIAFPSSQKEIIRSGTWSTVRYARKKGKNLVIIYPDGGYDSNLTDGSI